jgi:large conductance mechanosensitive channel
MRKLAAEFREFAFKGNMIELAVAVIIGGAFGKVVDSLVKHLLMPAISVVLPAQESYTGWTLVVNGKPIPYGLFLGEVVNFLLVALAVFIFIVKFLGWVMRRRETEAPAPAGPTRTEQLLAEIRDLLQARQR